jgi:hypothetical protein
MNKSQCWNYNAYLLSFAYHPIYAGVNYLCVMILLFLHSRGPFFLFPLRVEDHNQLHSKPEAFGHMSAHCWLSDLGPFRLKSFSDQMGNRTRAPWTESYPVEINVTSAMKGKPGLATGLILLGAFMPDSPLPETCVN